jgi:WD40 repeat protein
MPQLSKAAKLGQDSQTPARSGALTAGGTSIPRPAPSPTAISPASVVAPLPTPAPPRRKMSTAGKVLLMLGVALLSVLGAVAVAFVIDPDGRKATDFSPNATRNQAPIHQHQDPKPTTAAPPPKTYPHEIRRFRGHTGTIERLAVTSNGLSLLSASYDKSIRLWDIGSGKDLHTFTGHTEQVFNVAFQPDGKRFASCDTKGNIFLWDYENRSEVRRWSVGNDKRLWFVGFTANGQWLVCGGDDRTAQVWEANNGNLKATLKGHKDRVHNMSLHPDSKQCLTASLDHSVRRWELESGKQLKEYNGHTAGVTGVGYLPDGKRFVTVAHDKTARMWDLESGQVLHTFAESNAQLWNLHVSPDGSKLATTGEDKIIRIYDLEERKLFRELRGPEKGSPGLCWLPDSKRILTAGHDHQIVLWDVSKK